jgi:hypothetical protein
MTKKKEQGNKNRERTDSRASRKRRRKQEIVIFEISTTAKDAIKVIVILERRDSPILVSFL